MAAKMLNVHLQRQWDGHEAGEIVTVEAITAKSMVRKGYGEIVTARQAARLDRASSTKRPPTAETATQPPEAETTNAAPEPQDAPADASPEKAGD